MPTARYPKPIRRFHNTIPLNGESYLEAKFRQECLVTLARKVANAKPQVDCGPPRTISTVRLKLKKLMEESLILADLEFKNRHMLKRIIATMNAPASTDNHLNIRNRPTSLNFGFRMMEADRINQDNLRMLGRILQAKTVYDRVKQEEDYLDLHKGRKTSRQVYRLWEQMSDERKRCILKGDTVSTSKYGHMDPDELLKRFHLRHQYCRPEYFCSDSCFFSPVPPSSRSAPDAKKVDHSRCLRDDRLILPPISRDHHRPRSSPQSPIKSTRTTTLRAEEVKKRAYNWERNLPHSAGTFTENRPGAGEKSKYRAEDEGNKSASASPFPDPRSAAYPPCDHFPTETATMSQPAVRRHRKSLSSTSKKAVSTPLSRVKSQWKKQQTGYAALSKRAEVKSPHSDGPGEGEARSSLSSLSSDSKKDSTLSTKDASSGPAPTKRQPTDSEEEASEKPPPSARTADPSQRSRYGAATGSVSEYPPSVTTDEDPPLQIPDEGNRKEEQWEAEVRRQRGSCQTVESASAAAEASETVVSDDTSRGGDDRPPSSWVYTSVESPSLSPRSPEERALTAASFSSPLGSDATESETEDASEEPRPQE